MIRLSIVLAALALLLASCASTGKHSVSPGQAAPFRLSNASVRSLIEDKLVTGAPNGQPRVRSVSCQQGVCQIDYTPDEFVFKVDEDVTALSPIWKTLFSNRRFHSATFKAWGQTTSVGGKKSISPLFTLTCDRAAAAQIDWNNVDAHGVKTLCQWAPLVNFK